MKSNPDRIRLARQAHGLKQTDIADRLGYSRQYIHQTETDYQQTLNQDMLEVFAELYDVDVSFFFKESKFHIRPDQCNFRKQKTTSKGFSDQIIAKSTIFEEVAQCIKEFLDLPKVTFPKIEVSTWRDIEKAALTCRSEWGLDEDAPIHNVTRAAENAGAIVVNVSGVNEKISALSVDSRTPLIMHNELKDAPSRLRFDLSHEIGHFVMHEGIVTGDPKTEEEADFFAGAFLLPWKAFVKEYPRSNRFNWRAIFDLKKRWNVSAQAIVRRAYNLSLITATQYKSACIYISRNGYRKSEPFESKSIEHPELVKNAFSTLNKHLSIYKEDIAEKTGLTPGFLENVLGVKLADKPKSAGNVVDIRMAKKGTSNT